MKEVSNGVNAINIESIKSALIYSTTVLQNEINATLIFHNKMFVNAIHKFGLF